jgi:hypothetical protein
MKGEYKDGKWRRRGEMTNPCTVLNGKYEGCGINSFFSG